MLWLPAVVVNNHARFQSQVLLHRALSIKNNQPQTLSKPIKHYVWGPHRRVFLLSTSFPDCVRLQSMTKSFGHTVILSSYSHLILRYTQTPFSFQCWIYSLLDLFLLTQTCPYPILKIGEGDEVLFLMNSIKMMKKFCWKELLENASPVMCEYCLSAHALLQGTEPG